MDERVTVLINEETMFILGGENIMKPDQTFKLFLTSLTEGRERCVKDAHWALCPLHPVRKR
jgi:hypothetical protein